MPYEGLITETVAIRGHNGDQKNFLHTASLPFLPA